MRISLGSQRGPRRGGGGEVDQITRIIHGGRRQKAVSHATGGAYQSAHTGRAWQGRAGRGGQDSRRCISLSTHENLPRRTGGSGRGGLVAGIGPDTSAYILPITSVVSGSGDDRERDRDPPKAQREGPEGLPESRVKRIRTHRTAWRSALTWWQKIKVSR